MSTETLSLTELRPRLSEIVERARQVFDRFVITRQGRAEAVLLAADDFEGLLETIEILSDNDLLQQLAEAEEELAHGGGHSLEEVRKELRNGAGATLDEGYKGL